MEKFKFNDDAVKPFVEEIANLGISKNQINEEQYSKIEELLKVYDYSEIEELRAVRNSVVKLFEKEKDKYRYEGYFDEKNFDKYDWAMKGCIMIIDSRMWDLGDDL